MKTAFTRIFDCLMLDEPVSKCRSVTLLWSDVQSNGLETGENVPVTKMHAPGRPSRPELVEPGKVPRRRLGNEEGRAALIHAIAHIEFNAINLALDAAWRFRNLPPDYAIDWLSVAADEARHFMMLNKRLESMGYEYGDYAAHNGLWEMAEKTAGSCLERMALVPRVLEARGLDVTPGMMKRLEAVGDHETVAILAVILEEEVGHVNIGSQWFKYCCEQEGKEPVETFRGLLRKYFGGRLRGPFNFPARKAAGFSKAELEALENL